MSLTDYSSLEGEINNAPEPRILKRGTEALCRVIAVRSGTSDKNDDCQWYQPVFDVPDDPMVMEFNDFFWDLVDAKDKVDPKQQARNMYKFQTFAKAFHIDLGRPFSWDDDVVGKTGYLIAGTKKTDEYGEQNTVQKYVTGPKGKKASAGAGAVNKPDLSSNEPY